MNEPPDRGLPYCPNCGAVLARANRPADGEGFDFECITARCSVCDCSVRIRMRPVGMQLVDDSLGDAEVAFAGSSGGSLTAAVVARWQGLPNRIRWLIACYAILLFSPYFVKEYGPRAEIWVVFTFAPHFALASLLGLWAASGPRLSLERLFLALLAAVVLGAIIDWCFDQRMSEALYWFTPGTAAAFAVFAAFAWYGWRVRKVPRSEQVSDAAAFQFSVRQLMVLTAVIGVATVVVQQLTPVLRNGPDDFWGPIGMGVVTAPAFFVMVWALLGIGRMLTRILLAVITIQLLGLVAVYAIDQWRSEAVFIVLSWSFFAYFVLLSVPLLALRSCGFRFTRTASVRERLNGP